MTRVKPVYIYAIGWVILVLGVVVYVNLATSATIQCVGRVQEVKLEGDENVREFARLRDDADHEVKRLAIDQGMPLDDIRVKEAWGAYDSAHKALSIARRQNPIPDPKEYC